MFHSKAAEAKIWQKVLLTENLNSSFKTDLNLKNVHNHPCKIYPTNLSSIKSSQSYTGMKWADMWVRTQFNELFLHVCESRAHTLNEDNK